MVSGDARVSAFYLPLTNFLAVKLVFFGTPDFSAPFLSALLEEKDLEVLAVVTQPDKPVGRDRILTPPAVKVRAIEASIPVLQFPSLRKSEAPETLKALGADVFVVVAYGKLIPQEILDIPRLGCVNVHPSLLPNYRGPSPIQAAIANGDTQTAISIMLLDAGMDTGPILGQKTVEVKTDDTYATLASRLQEVGGPFLVDVLRGYASGALQPIPQDDSRATITTLLDRESGKIDFTESPETIDRKIRAYHPWPGCYTIVQHNGAPLRVKLLPNQMVQPEGKKPMTTPEFERGYGTLRG